MMTNLNVNLHCHSMFSDGELTPEALAELLATNNVRFAALTDHDTIEGQQRFRAALEKVGIEYIPGIELTTFFNGQEIHLLGYGFKVDDPDLNKAILSIRQAMAQDNVSIADSLRKRSTNQVDIEKFSHRNSINSGKLETAEGIRLIHKAGGCVFLAHPFTLEKEIGKLTPLFKKLKEMGLNGIEAVYPEYSTDAQQILIDCASDLGMLICAGTDFHYKGQIPAVAFDRQHWVKLRSLFFSNQGFWEGSKSTAGTQAHITSSPNKMPDRHHHFQKRTYILRIFLPTLIAITLFLSAIWVFVLPSFESTLLDRKREMIRELTNSALSVLTSYYNEEQAGTLTRVQAQALAIDRVKSLRYGDEGKDYFWIQDLKPTMLMHPYLPELDGEVLLDYKDARGVRIFVEFSNLVQREGEGYIDYVWQWKDDPDRLEPKESFVKLFKPWNWIIGTGIYTDDVNMEIARIEKEITTTSVIVSVVIILLLLYVLQQSLQIEKDRQEVLDKLRESTDRYHTVIESMTEGTLLLIDNRCRYANSTFINMIGYSEIQLPLLDLDDILPRCIENQAIWDVLDRDDSTNLTSGSNVDGYLQNKEGKLVDCLLMLNPIQYANQNGYILLARDIAAGQVSSTNSDGLAKVVKNIDVGVFRARAVRRGAILEINPAGYAMLPPECKSNGAQPGLADLFHDSTDYDQFINELRIKGQINNFLLHLHSENMETLTIALSATLDLDDAGQPYLISGLLTDVTRTHKLLAEHEVQINRLQSSLLFFHEPLSKFDRSILTCDMHTTISQLARNLSQHNLSAALISSEKGEILGIVTDQDLRERVLAQRLDTNMPAYSVMTSPVVKISESAMIYEAMIKMEENGLRHLAVEDESGKIVNLLDMKMLAQFPRYGAYVLSHEITHTANIEELAKVNQRKYKAVKVMLDSSRNVRYATSILSSIHDSSTEQIFQWALEELGPPPAPFAFIAMGSQGRQEPTLVADQDNGIIYLGNNHHDQYFFELGNKVSQDLNTIGFKFCNGNVMSSNATWCKPLEAWKIDFNRWVTTPEPQQLLDLSIFFDFRLVYGETQLVQDLRNHIKVSLQDRSDFFHLYAQQSQKFKSPSRGIGGIFHAVSLSESSDREIDLKDLIMPVVNFARLYALRNGIQQTNTIERLNVLAERGIISTNTQEDILTTYDFVMQLRIKNQISQIEAGLEPNNITQLGKKSDIHQIRLREALSQKAVLQKRITFDFLGGIQ